MRINNIICSSVLLIIDATDARLAPNLLKETQSISWYSKSVDYLKHEKQYLTLLILQQEIDEISCRKKLELWME